MSIVANYKYSSSKDDVCETAKKRRKRQRKRQRKQPTACQNTLNILEHQSTEINQPINNRLKSVPDFMLTNSSVAFDLAIVIDVAHASFLSSHQTGGPGLLTQGADFSCCSGNHTCAVLLPVVIAHHGTHVQRSYVVMTQASSLHKENNDGQEKTGG